VLGLGVLAFGIWLLARNREALARTLAEVGAGPMVLSGLLAIAGTVLIGVVWLTFVRGLGVALPTVDARVEAGRVFFVTQLGKYLPGSLWPVVAQMQLGRRFGASRSTMLLANMLMLICLTVTGLGVGAVLLPWTSSAGIEKYWWTLLLLVPLALSLHPQVLPRALAAGLRLLGRDPEPIVLSGSAVLKATAWSLLVWLVMGLHIFVLTAQLGAGGAAALAAAVGAIGLGWAAGLIVIPVPAGAGVRDALLVATLTGELGATRAFAVAAASRALLLLADVLLAFFGILLGRWQQRAVQRRRSSEV
jgi:hypothetical protein